MSNSQWLESIRTFYDLPSNGMAVVAERVVDTLESTTDGELAATATQLTEMFNRLLRSAPIDVQKAVQNTSRDYTAENCAYVLGQISFAQLLVSQVANKRAVPEFTKVFSDPDYRSYILKLMFGGLTLKELADSIGDDVKVARQRIHYLRELGVTDFRSDGKVVRQFLTPTAAAYALSTLETAP
jgi:hypothetical protein